MLECADTDKVRTEQTEQIEKKNDGDSNNMLFLTNTYLLIVINI
jgi:hypothetical protein